MLSFRKKKLKTKLKVGTLVITISLLSNVKLQNLELVPNTFKEICIDLGLGPSKVTNIDEINNLVKNNQNLTIEEKAFLLSLDDLYIDCLNNFDLRTLTDNINRTGGDVRHAFDKHAGNLGATGCVSYMFKRKGIILIEKTIETEVDEVMMTALDMGALDVVEEDDCISIETDPAEVGEVAEKLESASLKVLSYESTLIPDNYVDLDEKQLATFTKMLDMLEDNDDVQEVIHNVNMPDEE